MSKDDRAKLYPRCGKLHPGGLARLARADDYDQVQAAAEAFAEYRPLFEGVGTNPGDKTLEDKFFEQEVGVILTVRKMELVVVLSAVGSDECQCIHAAVSLWCVLFLSEIEGAGASEYCMDIRMCVPTESVKD